MPLWAEQYATVGDRLLPSHHTPHPYYMTPYSENQARVYSLAFALMLAYTSALIYTNAMGNGMHPRMDMPLVYTMALNDIHAIAHGLHPCNT